MELEELKEYLRFIACRIGLFVRRVAAELWPRLNYGHGVISVMAAV
jgi:hypothetical protein